MAIPRALTIVDLAYAAALRLPKSFPVRTATGTGLTKDVLTSIN
jgi:hypothetical protein